MAEEKSFLQTIKLEISKSFRLLPYERVAFHKILGVLKSDAGTSILLKELEKGPEIRESTITILSEFNYPSVTEALVNLLLTDISQSEKLKILNHVETFGTAANIKSIIDFIESESKSKQNDLAVKKAFYALKVIGAGNEEALNFLISIATSDEYSPEFTSLAMFALSSFKIISTLENLLKKDNEILSYSAYRNLYILSTEIIDSISTVLDDESRLYTYSTDSEDKVILDIRVLLGKMSPRFDQYSNRIKTAFVSSMISCNHREVLIYTMKALTSKDPELVTMTLYTIYDNIQRLRDPDKLFRSLISLSTETEKDNELIIDIFAKYFLSNIDTRQFHILRDKMFGYIVVTLETYFETFRKEFMITDVAEKNFPENFQKIRNFILKRFTPELKKVAVGFLSHEESSRIQHVITDMEKLIKHIDDYEHRDLSLLLEVFIDADPKSRTISASRIEGINFEKRYLKTRIIRLCGIIQKLSIHEASSPLVNIYNYLKKYPDAELLHSTIRTLSILNYSYMLGEIEVQFNTGSSEDQEKGMNLLSLYYEQRSLNILFEFLQHKLDSDVKILKDALLYLNEREIYGNITAAEILKGIIDKNPSHEIKSIAIIVLGRCGFEQDIEYLDSLFYKMKSDEPKDVIVRSISSITSLSENFNKRQIIKYLQEYLKDPGIKVRINSCLLLAKLGYTDAIRSIRDMLIIKNKDIQRDILTILGGLKSIEFSFFLLSLMKEEYGISESIINVIKMLPVEDLKEIDGFVVNIFRKYEAPEIQVLTLDDKQKILISVDGLKDAVTTYLNFDLYDLPQTVENQNISELISRNIIIKELISDNIKKYGGILSRMSNINVTAYFTSPVKAAEAALAVKNSIEIYNRNRQSSKKINSFIQLSTESSKILNEEVLIPPLERFNKFTNLSFINKILCDEATCNLIRNYFSISVLPDIVFSKKSCLFDYYELNSSLNFLTIAQDIYAKIVEEENAKQKLQTQIDDEIKRMKKEARPTSSVAITRELDDIGVRMKNLLDEVDRFIQRRSTDRELNRNVHKMLENIYDMYKVEITRIVIK